MSADSHPAASPSRATGRRAAVASAPRQQPTEVQRVTFPAAPISPLENSGNKSAVWISHRTVADEYGPWRPITATAPGRTQVRQTVRPFRSFNDSGSDQRRPSRPRRGTACGQRVRKFTGRPQV